MSETTTCTSTYSKDVRSSSELLNAINEFKNISKNSSDNYGVITIQQDITLNETLILDEVRNLVIKGYCKTDPPTIKVYPGGTWKSYRGTIDIGWEQMKGCVSKITLQDLCIETPPKNNKRTIRVYGKKPVLMSKGTVRDLKVFVKDILLDNLTLLPPNNSQIYPISALTVTNTKKIVINKLTIASTPSTKLYGTGIRLNSVKHFTVKNSTFRDIYHSRESAVAPGESYALLVQNSKDSLLDSGHGQIYNNKFTRTSGQTIFIYGNGRPLENFVIEKNTLTQVAMKPTFCHKNLPTEQVPQPPPPDCGGRGIYLQEGKYFWVKDNTMKTVCYGGVGGGINAGSMDVSHIIIEDNTIKNVGNNDGTANNNTLNGYGMSIREETLVRNNKIIEYSSNHGIIIEPGAKKVEVKFTPIKNCGRNGVHIYSGYYGNGKYIKTKPERVPWGPVKNVIVRDCFIKNNKAEGVYITGKPSHPDAKVEWNYFDVILRYLSLHDNQNRNTGIRVLGPKAYWQSSPNPDANIFYGPNGGNQAYNGQRNYSVVDTDVNVSNVDNLPYLNFSTLENRLQGLSFPSETSTGARCDFTKNIATV